MRQVKDNVLVFDLETIADLTPVNCAAVAALAKGREMTPEAYGGLCPPLARVVCLSWLEVGAGKLGALFDASLCGSDLAPSMLWVEGGGEDRVAMPCALQRCASETELLREFGRLVEWHLGQPGAQLVTFNGRGFDLPVLIHRSIKHGVTDARDLLLKAVAENRARPELHLDLLDLVTFCGAAPRFPLAAYALGYGWRSPKEEMQGSEVGSAVQAGRLLDVVRYCAGDVLATSHVYACINAPPDQPAP